MRPGEECLPSGHASQGAAGQAAACLPVYQASQLYHSGEDMQVNALVASLRQQVAQLQEALQREAQRAQQLDEQLQRCRLSVPQPAELACGGGAAAGAGPAASCAPLTAGPALAHTHLAPPAGQYGGHDTTHPQQQQQHGEQHQARGQPQQQHQQAQQAQAPPSGEDLVLIGRSELELLRLKERAMNAVMEGITIADCSQPDQPLIYINDGFVRMTGYSAEYTLGKNCRFLQGPGTDLATVAELQEAIKAGRSCVVQLLNYKRSGDAFLNYLSVHPIHDPSGRLTHYVGIQSDISELVAQKRAELAAKTAAVQAAAATEAKSQFLARMSHEIRTPLNGMIAVGQLLADTSLTPAQWDLVNTIRSSGETLLTLISDILDFSRIEANKMVLSCKEFRLQSVVEAAMEIAGLQAAQKRLQVAYHMAGCVPSVLRGDAQRLQQVLLNILNNAVKFTHAGEILLEVWAGPLEEGASLPPPGTATGNGSGSASGLVAQQHQQHQQQQQQQHQQQQQQQHQQQEQHQQQQHQQQEQQQRQQLGARAEQGREEECQGCLVHFAVRDTGIGINPEDLCRLFQSFSQVDASTTRQYGGSGLGLTISQKLCEAMGGKMWAQSDGQGHGSTFRWFIRSHLPPSLIKQQQHEAPRLGRQRQQQAKQAKQGASAAAAPAVAAATAPPLQAQQQQQQQAQQQQAPPPPPPQQQAQQRQRSQEARPQLAVLPAPLAEKVDKGGAASQPSVRWRRSSELRRSLELSGVAGKKILLVEPCRMVRQVLSVALQRWGCQVCVVDSEEEAIGRLALVHPSPRTPASPPPGAAGTAGTAAAGAAGVAGIAVAAEAAPAGGLQRCSSCTGLSGCGGGSGAEASTASGLCQKHAAAAAAAAAQAAAAVAQAAAEGGADDDMMHLTVQFSANGLSLESQCEGHFDVVIMDMSFGGLLQALMSQCQPHEAQRVVFMGWPGQNDPEEEERGGAASSRATSPGAPASRAAVPAAAGAPHSSVNPAVAQPPKALRDSLAAGSGSGGGSAPAEAGRRQLGYVVVTRPVRQGRLRLALEEVVTMQMDPIPGPGSSSGQEGAAGAAGSAAGGSASAGGGAASADDHMSDDGRLSTLSGGSCGSLRCALGSVLQRARSHGNVADLPNEDNSQLRLLLAEDNAINMKVALGILKRIGYTNITTAEDGEEALKAVEGAGGPDAFHVILTDLHMPRMGGMEVVREVRRRWPKSRTRIVAVTADAFEDTRDSCIAVGFDGWLAKPFRVEEFAKVMSRYKDEQAGM